MRIAIEIMYDGSVFCGWQIQPGGPSVQQQVEDALSRLLGRKTEVTGCGRTDTGVHASQYFAHFDIERSELDKFSVYQLNAVLPPEVAVRNLFRTDDDFHARYSSTSRKYIYHLHTLKDPFLRRSSFLHHNLDSRHLPAMQEIADLIAAQESFGSFAKSKSGLTHHRCRITESRWTSPSDGQFEFHIAANRFVRGMVRLCVGACLNYASERISLEEIKKALVNEQQIPKSWSVPAHALFLTEVLYPEHLLNRLS